MSADAPSMGSKPRGPSTIRTLVIAGLVGVLASGCIFSPKKGGGGGEPPPAEYPERDTPINAILFLKAVWEKRDSTRAGEAFDSLYAGSSFDPNDENPATLSFTKLDEVRAVAGIQADLGVQHIQFDLKPPVTWVRVEYTTDPPDWVAYSLPNPEITIELRDGNRLLVDNAEHFEFKLKPTVVAPGDTTWQVIRWSEIKKFVLGT